MQTFPVTKRMDVQLTHWEAVTDKRSIFLSCYRRMTQNMLNAIQAGRFSDPLWVGNLLDNFAAYYFDALATYERGDGGTPEIWIYTHDISRSADMHVLQYLLLGINAHINYDLVLALHDALCDEWDDLPGTQRRIRREDHFMVNRIIAETIDIVQDTVVERHSPFMGIVDVLLGRVDERLLSSLIANWRKRVWEKTVTMLTLESDRARQDFIQNLEGQVLATARNIAHF